MSWYGPIARNLGLVLTRFAGVITSLVAVSIIWGEYYAIPAELLSAAIVYAVGWLLLSITSVTDDTSTAQAFASAAIVWLVVGLISALPFAFVAGTIALDPGGVATPSMNPTVRAFLSPTNAAFEALSGITGTGLTVTRRASELSATLQWWRSLLEWLGGIGIIVLILSVVRRSDGNVLNQYYEERSPLGQSESGIPSPKAMLGVFTTFTVLSIVLLWIAGMPPWHAIKHGMTGLSTGGFTVTDHSIATYDSLAIRLVLLPIMFIGAIPLPVYYLLLEGNLDGFATDRQTRWLLFVTAAGTTLLAAYLVTADVYRSTVEGGVTVAFQFVSAITCTGFSTATNMGTIWPPSAMVLLTVAMTVGGSEGSTASGIKIVRVVSLAKGVRERVSEPFPETDSSREIEIAGEHVSANFYDASIITFLWIGFLLAGVFALFVTIPNGSAPLKNVLFEVASAQGNVGLSSGITTPSLSPSAKLILMGNMWVGRLTIIPVLVLLRGSV
ncbi:TrkH family potassium uptake protein [Natrinema sp. SYSU A 869]|uniref:TrkH family potassium uptake protein n=1 Tax=Natrinema sp. SYSU A 869 TaxID=2871694 RepID=UPI001CA40F46|nr:TrkH family potassium uptake protein [Natrinema sp. SYSU A 869]